MIRMLFISDLSVSMRFNSGLRAAYVVGDVSILLRAVFFVAYCLCIRVALSFLVVTVSCRLFMDSFYVVMCSFTCLL